MSFITECGVRYDTAALIQPWPRAHRILLRFGNLTVTRNTRNEIEMTFPNQELLLLSLRVIQIFKMLFQRFLAIGWCDHIFGTDRQKELERATNTFRETTGDK